ncbi:LysR substrate-binding domain-containing protein [Chitinimonas lacunae]|uniref:LysR substrate-binding domain-containing protein n=1 Tax=Chitinimonas lacunae TaxID=1963018 RepID=A0ABV8MUB4_9NEIS
MNRLPPLDALHCFVVVAREGNMSRAAERLFITQSAVSRQIRQLENHLGLALFVREPRGLSLTLEGRTLLPAAEAAFDGLARAVEALAGRPAELQLKLPPLFALRCFLPRLGEFQARHPDIEVRMNAVPFQRIHFEREDFDAAILYARTPPPEVYAEALASERLTVVCSPATAARLERPADLALQPLIRLGADLGPWTAWLTAAGINHPAVQTGPERAQLEGAIDAASQGLGVLLTDPLLIAGELASGRLLEPFPTLRLDSGFAYWFCCPRTRRDERPLAALRQWLRESMAMSMPQSAG